MAEHKCDLSNCDGTRLGHDLARDFSEGTRQIVESFKRILDKDHEFTVDPANLQVDPFAEAIMRPRLCPECVNGKVINCVGQALDPVTDEFVPCEGGPE